MENELNTILKRIDKTIKAHSLKTEIGASEYGESRSNTIWIVNQDSDNYILGYITSYNHGGYTLYKFRISVNGNTIDKIFLSSKKVIDYINKSLISDICARLI